MSKNDYNNSERRKLDVPFFESNLPMLEHILLLACIKSFKFYSNIKTKLSPKLPDGRSFRPDFTQPDYNRIHTLVSKFWEGMASLVKDEMDIKPDLMETILSKDVARGAITPEQGSAIAEWLSRDIRTIDLDPELLRNLPNSPIFLKWIEGRAIEYEQRRLQPTSLGRVATFEDWQESSKAIAKTIIPPSSQVVNGSAPFNAMMNFFQPIYLTSLPLLNQIIGGGIRHKDTAVVGAISGGGKTIMAMQFALEFALSGRNTIVLTTEQPPWQLLMRAISNHLIMDFSLFTKRIERAVAACQMSSVQLPFVPEECYATPEKWDTMEILRTKFDAHLRFVDWSEGGMSLVQNFDSAIEQVSLNEPGWEPEVIIVDWVGGGLDHRSSQNNELRHFYKAAGETIIQHGKRNNRAMIMMAQLNKMMVKPKTGYVTMDMLAECKSLVDNAATFIGVTALRATNDDDMTIRLQPKQFLCADKARWGTGGKIRVIAEFQYQRFIPLSTMQPAERTS